MPGDFRTQIEALRPYLLRYASMQLRNTDAAEDAVQEALLAALSAEGSFAGRSNLRTWLTGILKHKVVDAIRRQSRELPASAAGEEVDLSELDPLFAEDGHFKVAQPAWEGPEDALGQKQFFAALEECLARLPVRTGRVFLMREHMGLETGEICKELGITPTHCWVLLYRARMALRECLQTNWFGK